MYFLCNFIALSTHILSTGIPHQFTVKGTRIRPFDETEVTSDIIYPKHPNESGYSHLHLHQF